MVLTARIYILDRWSVKEAAYKAMFPALRPTWKELTYRNDGKNPKPQLLYQSTDVKIHASVSHDGDYVFTSVMVETPKSN